MFDRLFFVLFNIKPKPLAHIRTVEVYDETYVIHSQNPVIITEKDSGYIQIKSFGKMFIYCGKMLHVSVRKNTSSVTIGWAKGKSQIFEVRKNVKDTAKQTNSSHSNSSYVPPYYDHSSNDDNHRTSSSFCSNDNSSSDCSSSDSGGGDGGGGD
ncbi:hypothetical protein ABN063_13550 [Providencia vermicola]|uniref:hypothetical protein n=1 Tax=Providencia vermicola TaxID=333965 RepID=UPI001CED8C6B|nr:hypothetical protein [Providencia vermicola]